jgi:threonine dehydrogenase-like Zn-dependent dehydrogenase
MLELPDTGAALTPDSPLSFLAAAEASAALPTVAVVGLGYVGLPVAVAFGRHRKTIGYDLSTKKVWRLKQGLDTTGEVSTEELRAAQFLSMHDDGEALREADFVIVAVPTPVNDAHQPDFGPLEGASRTVGKHLKRGATVIYESTVYPGTTEEICVPILERCSGMRWKHDFHVGYSPERINPGDKEHSFTRITKVVSGDDDETLEKVAQLYGSVVEAGVYKASSIRVAEAAKVIENTQRDLNIAFVNELADHLRPPRHRHRRGAAGRGHEVEFPAVPAGARRRPLHRRRSVLPHAQGRARRLPPAGDPRRAPHQRRHGRLRRAQDRAADDPRGAQHHGARG